MRTGLVTLALWIGAVQTVSATDCACAACQGREACPGCVQEDPAPSHDCCSGEEGAPAKGKCTHLEPSREVLLDAAMAAPNWVSVDTLFPVGWSLGFDWPDAFTPADPVPRPAREGPLNLLNSVFII